ncbi:hypothetical protein ACE6H2_007898 [Prunus campanulata]
MAALLVGLSFVMGPGQMRKLYGGYVLFLVLLQNWQKMKITSMSLDLRSNAVVCHVVGLSHLLASPWVHGHEDKLSWYRGKKRQL